MSNTYEVIFQLMEESESEIVSVQSYEEANEMADIAELARFSEAIRDPEPSSFLIG